MVYSTNAYSTNFLEAQATNCLFSGYQDIDIHFVYHNDKCEVHPPPNSRKA